MTSSAREPEAAGGREHLSSEWLDALLSAVAGAPDLPTAARFLVAQFADAAEAHCGFALMLDARGEHFANVASIGYDAEVPPGRLADDLSDPFVVSALSMLPVHSHDEARRSFVSIPFSQPRGPDAPSFISPIEARRRMRDGNAFCNLDAVLGDSAATSLRAASSPCGVVVLETQCDEALVSSLVNAARLVGPIVWRIAALEAHRASTQQLGEQRSVLTSIVNSLPDPIVIINAEHEIVVQNRRAEHLLSMEEEDSEGRRRAVEINNLLFTSHLSKTVIDAGSAAPGTSRELNMVDPDEGTDLLFEVLTQPLDDDAAATVSVLRDVTDLRRAAGELERQVQRVRLAEFEAKRERDRLNLILTNVADPILVTDDRSNIILMNRQAELLFGAAAADTSGATRPSAVRSNDTKFTSFISDFALNPATSRREEMVFLTPANGESIPIEVVSGKIVDRRGETIAIVSVLHDLTEQVENERLYEELKKFSSELEARVREATSDLAEQNVRLQWQSRELEKANRLKSEFLASMSHELRTPINALIGYTALLLDRIYGEITDRQEEGLTRIQAAAQHLLALINDILDLAKIEAGRMPLHLDDLSLGEIIREINVQMEPLVRKKRLEYRVDVPDATIAMHTDRTKIKQILLNLVSNAIKFTHTGGITVKARREGDIVRIDVADTGIGIRKEDLAAVWDDFRQVDQSRTREFGGTGLGLSITRKLVGALGGRVNLTSDYGTGSTFTVFLPLETLSAADGSAEGPGERPGKLTRGSGALD